MASRLGPLGWCWRSWAHGAPHLAAAAGVAASAACLGGQRPRPKKRPLRAEEESHGDTSDLRAHHLYSWQEGGTGWRMSAEGLYEKQVNKIVNPMYEIWPKMIFVDPDERVRGRIIVNDSKADSRPEELDKGCVRANACRHIWWRPDEVRAAIVTCGGLCPGLNSIVREVTLSLWRQYGVKHVMGIQFGYNGLSNPDEYAPLHLTPRFVREIHMKGGSVLTAGRGGMEPEKICDNLERMGINMLFVVGGDGTQAAGNMLYREARRRNMEISIVGVPKSIDNDILFFDKTFGFETAVSAACDVIHNAWVEATSCPRGVGIVKLMGRDAGFIAVEAALSSTLVDLCLIPEVSVKLEHVMEHIDEKLARKNFMVIAVAEGAGQEHVATGEVDDTGHTIYGDIGVFLRDAVNKHLKPSGGRCFYIDPSYIIRSVPIEPNDHIYCSRLARDAVHTAMRGYTGVVVGPIHNHICILPMELIAGGKRRIGIKSSQWQSCLQVCNMPRTLSGRPA